MKTSEVKKLKITALNIRSVLTEKNKQIAKLERKKIRLVRRQGLLAERATAERNLEMKGNKRSPIRGLLSNVSNTVMNPLMKIVNFFIFTLLGNVIKDLPKFISGLKKTWKVVKTTLSILWKIMKFIINPLWELGKLIDKSGIFKSKKEKENPKEDESQSELLTDDGDINSLDIEENVGDTSESITPDTGEGSDTDSSSPGAPVSSPTNSLTKSPINSGKVMNSVSEGGGIVNEDKNIENVNKRVKIAKRTMISRINKAKDLNGNLEDLDIKTIIVPIERNVVVENGGQNNSSMGLSSPPAPMATSKRR